MRFYSNPIHYIRNHEAWIGQMTKIYKEFDRFQVFFENLFFRGVYFSPHFRNFRAISLSC